eukprot:Skav203359  [mRNA]  locus=scaffold1076:557218:567194:+ [translate_table: standard]
MFPVGGKQRPPNSYFLLGVGRHSGLEPLRFRGRWLSFDKTRRGVLPKAEVALNHLDGGRVAAAEQQGTRSLGGVITCFPSNVQHVRDRVKKMCHELGQVCEMPAEKAPPPKQVDEAALTAKLKMLMSNFSQEAGQPQPQEDRTDMCRRMMSERDEVLRLEKELETLQLTLVKPSDLPGDTGAREGGWHMGVSTGDGDVAMGW